MLRPTLLRASRSSRLRTAIEANRISRGVVARFVAGEDAADAITAVEKVHRQGMMTSLDVLGEDVTDLASARHVRDQYLSLLFRLHQAGQAARSEVSLKLSALGQRLPGGGHDLALRHAREICVAADAVDCRVTLDMEDHTTVDSTLAIGIELRTEFPLTANVLQANLKRTHDDIAALSRSGARVRLVKGAYREPKDVAYQRKSDVDDAYQSGIRMLMASSCYPMIATHDPFMIREAANLADRFNRTSEDWEVQMLFGIGSGLRRELLNAGRRIRVYVPFGEDWYGYFMRRLAERPANVAFFLRALAKG
ncbi:MAG TPA: proline dehydrogenase family protein [Streptosporangiaceae bacterium]|nr:proline dehydrogenase family protein [Streptosporangiaceae bacterium]